MQQYKQRSIRTVKTELKDINRMSDLKKCSFICREWGWDLAKDQLGELWTVLFWESLLENLCSPNLIYTVGLKV